MEGLIPMVYRAIKNSRTRRQYKCLSSTELVPLYTMASPVKGLSWVGPERRAAGHRRNKSSGDISSSVDIDYGRCRGSGSVAPAKKQLEDPVLLVPEDQEQKPYVAIIKDIGQTYNGSIMVTGQWFYRPEEAERKGGGSCQSRDTRELFYSFHRDEVPAESVMHKCVVHFVPIHKQLPSRKQHPGFIVQKVYDTVERKLWRLTDKDYEDTKQHEIDLLVQKTLARLGELNM